jgi:hypothetical protein
MRSHEVIKLLAGVGLARRVERQVQHLQHLLARAGHRERENVLTHTQRMVFLKPSI